MDNKPSNNCCKEMKKMHMVLWCKRFNSLIYKVVRRRLACGSCIIRLCAVCFEFNASGRMCTPHFQWSKSSDGMILQPSTFDAHFYPKQENANFSLFPLGSVFFSDPSAQVRKWTDGFNFSYSNVKTLTSKSGCTVVSKWEKFLKTRPRSEKLGCSCVWLFRNNRHSCCRQVSAGFLCLFVFFPAGQHTDCFSIGAATLHCSGVRCIQVMEWYF